MRQSIISLAVLTFLLVSSAVVYAGSPKTQIEKDEKALKKYAIPLQCSLSFRTQTVSLKERL